MAISCYALLAISPQNCANLELNWDVYFTIFIDSIKEQKNEADRRWWSANSDSSVLASRDFPSQRFALALGGSQFFSPTPDPYNFACGVICDDVRHTVLEVDDVRHIVSSVGCDGAETTEKTPGILYRSHPSSYCMYGEFVGFVKSLGDRCPPSPPLPRLPPALRARGTFSPNTSRLLGVVNFFDLTRSTQFRY